MTYTYNDQAIFEAVAGSKAIIRRPIGMFDFRWKTYAAGVVDALNSKGSTSALELGEAIHKAMLDGVKESVAKEPQSMKLVDILARELKVWPDQYYQIYQDSGGNLHGTLSNGDLEDCDQEDLPGDPVTIAWDGNAAVVDRAEWQAAVDTLKVAEGIADAEAGNLIPLDDVKSKYVEYSPAMHAQRVGRVVRKNRQKADAQTDDTLSMRQFIGRGWSIPIYNIDEIGIINWPRRVYSFDLPPRLCDLDAKPDPKAEPKPVEWDGEGLPPVGVDCEVLDDMKAGRYAPVRVIIHDEGRAVFRYTGGANKGDHDSAGHGSPIHQLPIFRPVRTAEQIAAEEQKPKSTAQENKEFLEARVKELEAQNIELVKQSWLPNKEAATARDRIKDLESQLEQLTADNEALSDIVVQLDDNAIQVLVRARDGDGLYFTSKEGQKVSVIRSGD